MHEYFKSNELKLQSQKKLYTSCLFQIEFNEGLIDFFNIPFLFLYWFLYSKSNY